MIGPKKAGRSGAVTSQYLQVCQEHTVVGLEGLALGKVLRVTPGYFDRAAAAVLEIGIKLGHVLWRKLVPPERVQADADLNRTTYQLLTTEEYALAGRLLEFATNTLKKHSSEEARLMFVVNLAQAYKWSGRSEACASLIQAIDWSATSRKFRLAVHILMDKFDEAETLMREIGSGGEINTVAYRDWPLFKEWRQSSGFLRAYQDVFGTEFHASQTEVKSGPTSELSLEPTTTVDVPPAPAVGPSESKDRIDPALSTGEASVNGASTRTDSA